MHNTSLDCSFRGLSRQRGSLVGGVLTNLFLGRVEVMHAVISCITSSRLLMLHIVCFARSECAQMAHHSLARRRRSRRPCGRSAPSRRRGRFAQAGEHLLPGRGEGAGTGLGGRALSAPQPARHGEPKPLVLGPSGRSAPGVLSLLGSAGGQVFIRGSSGREFSSEMGARGLEFGESSCHGSAREPQHRLSLSTIAAGGTSFCPTSSLGRRCRREHF